MSSLVFVLKFKVGLITPLIVFTHLNWGLMEVSNLADNWNAFVLIPWPDAPLFVLYVNPKPSRSKDESPIPKAAEIVTREKAFWMSVYKLHYDSHKVRVKYEFWHPHVEFVIVFIIILHTLCSNGFKNNLMWEDKGKD